jgi:hypothetical protein
MTPGGTNVRASFENPLSEEDRQMGVYIALFGEEFVKQVTESIAYRTEESAMVCPELENNQIYKVLRNKMRMFFF